MYPRSQEKTADESRYRLEVLSYTPQKNHRKPQWRNLREGVSSHCPSRKITKHPLGHSGKIERWLFQGIPKHLQKWDFHSAEKMILSCLLNSTTIYWCLVSVVQCWSRTLCLPPFQWCTTKQYSVWRFPRLDKAISSSLYWLNLCHHLGGLLCTHSTALISFFYKDLQTRQSTLHEASQVVNRGERLPSEELYRKWRPWENKKIHPA